MSLPRRSSLLRICNLCGIIGLQRQDRQSGVQGDSRANPSCPPLRPEEAASAAVAECGARVAPEWRSHRLCAGFDARPEYDLAARRADRRRIYEAFCRTDVGSGLGAACAARRPRICAGGRYHCCLEACRWRTSTRQRDLHAPSCIARHLGLVASLEIVL